MSTQVSEFTATGPQREWLVRCQDGERSTAVCTVEANNGTLGISGPHGEYFSLENRQIAVFQQALSAAITQVADDVRHPVS
ncbi:hypothetical protein ACFWY9_38605 [Amycolatopsis sp. NPDC059027]|uniref:hypothetical protein n=1 Tax=unclassified Amycolatopsis TaxID=2618356 RepID=UPI0036712FAF